MSRKSLLMALGIILLLVGSAGTALALLVSHEPDFYRKAAMQPGEDRKRLATAFANNYAQFLFNVKNEEKKWDTEFTQEQINSFLEEDLARPGNLEKNFPEGIREPRIAIDANRVRFAFRYGTDPWSTVVSIDLNVWLTAKEPNVVALQLEGLHAGSLPISAQSMLDRFAESLREKDIEVTWYRHEGKPVALLRFQPGHKAPTVLLRHLKLEQGKIHIGVGVGNDSEEPVHVKLRPETIKPAAN
jgi:hypothetical protein